MAKKRKLKKGMILILTIVLFFVVYFLAFSFGKTMEQKDKEHVKIEDKKEDKRPLIDQIRSNEKIYISDSNVENIRIEEGYWSQLNILFSEFTSIRKPDEFTPIYSGYTSDGIRFTTNLEYFRTYTVNKEEYYKVPVATKKELEKVLGESIYLSFDFVRQYKSWKSVKVAYNDEVKKIYKWKYDDLSYKMASKRSVGKIQPEKSKKRSEHNFIITIKGKHYTAIVETMGKDYVKISTEEGENISEAYYEVHTGLYEYLVNDLFKIKNDDK